MKNDEEFIELLKSTINENGLNTIPGDDLIVIYSRAKSIEVSNNIPDIEFSKAINKVLEEIKKRGLSQDSKPQEKKQQVIHYYNDYSFTQNETGGSSKWIYAIAIPIIVIAIALVVNKSFFSEAPKEPTFRIQEYYEAHKNYYGDIPLENVAKDVYARGYADQYPDYDTWKKDVGLEAIIEADNERRKPSFLDKLKKIKVPFPFRFSEESIHGKLFRYDRFTRTVEIRYGYNEDTFKWMPRPQFKDLQHVRDALTQQEKNNHIRAIEEQTEELQRMQMQQQRYSYGQERQPQNSIPDRMASSGSGCTMCADGSFVAGSQCTMCANGKFVGGSQCTMCADGSFVAGSQCTMCANGKFVGGSQCTMCADGSFVAGSQCTMCANGKFVGGSQCTMCADGSYVGNYVCN